MMRRATGWYALPGQRRFFAEHGRDGADREPREGQQRAAPRAQVNQLTLPPDAVLIRRMHTMLAAVLYRLRAAGDWGAIAAEYLHGAPPTTALGQAEAGVPSGRARQQLSAAAAARAGAA